MRNWREEISSTDLPKSLFDVKHSNHDSERYLRHDQISKKVTEEVKSRSAKMALEKEKRENRKKESFKWGDERYAKKEDVEELRKELELLKQYAKKEEGDGWWKKKFGLLTVIGALFLGWVSPGKVEFGKLIEILLRN